MSHTIAQLNELLASSLGRNPYSEGIFRWEFSEDLFWPEFPTGRMIDKPVRVPIIGGSVECPECSQYATEDRKGEVLVWGDHPHYEPCKKCNGDGRALGEEALLSIKVPEYRREKMAPNLDRQWVVTIWMKPEDLAQWQAQFPGAPYPARGQRIHTNASLPSFEGGPRIPNLEETERFIRLMRFQRSHTLKEAEIGIDDERTANDTAVRKEIEDEIRDDFPAFMNIDPGARGGWVSTPYTKKDRLQ